MISDRPVARQRVESTPRGDVLVVELSVIAAADCGVAIVVDMSDSCDVSVHDFRRLRKLLQVVPREWRVCLGGTAASAPVAGATVGDIVDGVVDLEKLYLGADSVRRGRVGGSFLFEMLRRMEFDQWSLARSSTLLLVLTDGRLHDLGRLTLPPTTRCIGLAIGSGEAATSRWQEILPDNELLESSRPDLVAVIRDHAGCTFLGPCTIEIPGAEYRVRALVDAHLTQEIACRGGPSRWDFSTGSARVEIPLPFPGQLQTISIRSAAGSVENIAVDVASGCANTDVAPSTTGAVTRAHAVSISSADAKSLMSRLCELVSARRTWQDDEQKLLIPHPSEALQGNVTPDGRPRCDALVVVVPSDDAGAAASHAAIWVPIRRDERVDLASCLRAAGGGSMSVTSAVQLSYHRLEARWFMQSTSGAVALSPRGGLELDLDVSSSEGIRYRVFFSGPLRVVSD